MNAPDPYQPPDWAIRLLRRICHPDFRDEMEGDLREQYHADTLKQGPAFARRRLRAHLLSMIQPNLIFNLQHPDMQTALRLKQRPFIWLFIAAPVMLAVWLLAPQTRYPGATLFGLTMPQVTWLLPLVLVALGLLHIATRRWTISSRFSQIHTGITVTTVGLITALALLGISPSAAVGARHEWVGNGMQVLTLLFVLGQLAFLVWLGWGMLRQKRNGKQ